MCFTKRRNLDSFTHLLLVKFLGISDFINYYMKFKTNLNVCLFSVKRVKNVKTLSSVIRIAVDYLSRFKILPIIHQTVVHSNFFNRNCSPSTDTRTYSCSYSDTVVEGIT